MKILTDYRNVIPMKHDNYLMAFTDYSAFSVFIALIHNQLINPFQERTKTGEKKITKFNKLTMATSAFYLIVLELNLDLTNLKVDRNISFEKRVTQDKIKSGLE